MSPSIAPWSRPSLRPTDRRAVMLIAFAERDLLNGRADLELRGAVPSTAPVAALELRAHRYLDDPEWFDGWRTRAVRNIATGIDPL